MPPKLINYQDGMDHTIPTVPLQIVDALDMRAHDPGMCPLENCTGQVDYLVLVRWKRSYAWRPDHVIPSDAPAISRLLRRFGDREANRARIQEFLRGKGIMEIDMYETVHNCELFEDCGGYSTYQCREVNDFILQSGSEELVLRSGDICELHLLHPRMEELYCGRVVLGRTNRKKDHLKMRGISIPPRGRMVRPFIGDNGKLGYHVIPYGFGGYHYSERLREGGGEEKEE